MLNRFLTQTLHFKQKDSSPSTRTLSLIVLRLVPTGAVQAGIDLEDAGFRGRCDAHQQRAEQAHRGRPDKLDQRPAGQRRQDAREALLSLGKAQDSAHLARAAGLGEQRGADHVGQPGRDGDGDHDQPQHDDIRSETPGGQPCCQDEGSRKEQVLFQEAVGEPAHQHALGEDRQHTHQAQQDAGGAHIKIQAFLGHQHEVHLEQGEGKAEPEADQ